MVEDPVGPTALLLVDGASDEWRIDGRRSYSGWDDHEVVAWSLDLGDGSRLSGTDLLRAVVEHTYGEAGTYEVALTVVDDTGREATATHTIEVVGSPDGEPGTDAGPAAPDEEGTRELPETGGGLALLGIGALLVAGRLGTRR